MLKHQFPNLLFYPPDATVGESVKIPTPKTADDINDMFKELDSESDKKVPLEKKSSEREDKEDKEDKGADKKDKETLEDDEIELKEPEEEEEKLDLEKQEDDLDIGSPPRKKEILSKYPNLYKDFPFLEKMMYRDRQYNELFGSFDDAKEIAEKSETFNEFENQLLSGHTEEILKGVKESDEKAFNMIVDDYLPTLAKVDRDAYFHVVGNLNKRLIIEMVQEANDTNNDDLKQAALLVNQFVFGTAKFTAPTLRVPKSAESEANSENEKERLSFVKERFETARDDLQTRVDNTLRATISDYIDPKGVMSPYVKKNAVADAMNFLSSAITGDSTTVKNLDKLWRSSYESKFSKDSLAKIQSFYLGKARVNLKNAIIKARGEALKDSPRAEREKDEDEDKEETTSRRPARTIAPGRPSQSKGKNGPQKGESVTDFFMRD